MFGHYYYGFSPLGGIFDILIWVLIIGIIIRMIRGPRWHSYMHPRHWRGEKDALDILKERYAKGEINKEEYEQKKTDLER